jgi:solute carrier family 12 (sodium/potassium/chloride transporter), member 2
MSLSAISTNGHVPAGGIYYMVSRQLGSDIGLVVGLTLFLAQSFAVAMNLVGVAESIVNLQDTYMVSQEWDAKIWAFIGLAFVLCVAFAGASMEVQLQKGLFVVMGIAIINFFIGVFIAGQNDDLQTTGLDGGTLADNSQSRYTSGESWVTVFGVFFPAGKCCKHVFMSVLDLILYATVTGIAAGSSISGDLANPSVAIPKGTFLAILTTTVVYILMALLMAACFTPDGLANITTHIAAIDISLVPALGTAGIFAAGLSSAMALIIGAPRVLMALARDDLLDALSWLKKGYTAKDEPLRGYVLVLTIAFLAILFLDLNSVNPIVTNFYLLQYAAINWAVASAYFSRTPGWRPSFKYYHPYISLLGCVLCAASMFMVNYIFAFVTFIIAAALYNYIKYYKPSDSNWGESGSGLRYMNAVKGMYELEGKSVRAHRRKYVSNNATFDMQRPKSTSRTGDRSTWSSPATSRESPTW